MQLILLIFTSTCLSTNIIYRSIYIYFFFITTIYIPTPTKILSIISISFFCGWIITIPVPTMIFCFTTYFSIYTYSLYVCINSNFIFIITRIKAIRRIFIYYIRIIFTITIWYVRILSNIFIARITTIIFFPLLL